MADRKLSIIITGDAKGALGAFKQVEGGTSSLNSKLGGLVSAVGGAFATAKVIEFGKSLYNAATESAKVNRQTDAVLKSMGDSAGLTANQISNLSSKLSLQTGIDDELIQSGENVLLTFRNVRNEAGKGNDIFTRGTKAALDLSVALKKDLTSSTILVGKALNDPVKGIGALSRAGVQFTEQQKEQLKAMVAVGDTAGAQKMILKELESEFQGSAASQATGAAKAKVAWDNLQETLGGLLIPVVEKVTIAMAGMMAFLDEHRPILIALAAVVGTLLVTAFATWTVSLFTAGGALAILASPVVAVVAGIALLAAGVIYAYQNFETFRTVVDTVSQAIQATIDAVWPYIQQVITGVMNVISGVIETVMAVIHGDWGAAWDGIKQILTGVWDIIQGYIGAQLAVIRAVISAAMGAISAVWSAAWNLLKSIVSGAWDGVKSVVSGGVSAVVSFFSGLPGKISSVFGGLAAIIKAPFTAAFGAIKSLWNSTVGGFGFSVPSWVPVVGGKSFHIPNMHTGGIVPGGFLNEPIMRLQGGEGVFTAEQMRALSPISDLKSFVSGFVDRVQAVVEQGRQVVVNGGGQVVELHSHVYLNGHEIGVAVTEYQEQHSLRNIGGAVVFQR